ncbi:hypothetical protein K466DRAFT_580193 [Polyporus arcularius HHB13444]|uniref:Uncharacterized protein n=1 Tax=Polyporus arcularius HHB13444 TaxID=1314778 RepID=A0A5C3PZI3_9APHY|nr:hypothetical protein K466DRAFT_580193 [Polyporus arcularius HHB13444]
MLVEPAVKRNSRLVPSLERLNALERDLPGAVYVMLLHADQVSVEMEVARSLKYEVRCLHPGDSWPGTSDGLLIIGSEAEEVESVRADLLRHAVNRDTWEDVVVDALGMDRKDFWGVTTAWRQVFVWKGLVDLLAWRMMIADTSISHFSRTFCCCMYCAFTVYRLSRRRRSGTAASPGPVTDDTDKGQNQISSVCNQEL